MNRNTETHFNTIPRADIPRSKFDLSHSLKTSFNVGDVIPLGTPIEVLPGDTFSISSAKVVRMQTPIVPIMDNIYMDTYWFFVPNRLSWSHFPEFLGENRDSAWIPQTEYTIPTVTAPANTGWTAGTIADFMNVPTGIPDLEINALPFRAYARIMDEWFRDQNLTNPIDIITDDVNVTGSNGSNYITDLTLGGMPFKASRFHDRYSSALPSPQKGPDVLIDVTGGGSIPVFGNGQPLGFEAGSGENMSTDSLYYSDRSMRSNAQAKGTGSIGSNPWSVPTKEHLDIASLQHSATGLIADISDMTIMTINQLREAVQMQHFYEKLARSGSRMTEILNSMFGVTNEDARLQRSEYLGGNRIALNINQVVQTSATQAQTGLVTTPQGTTGAYSLTSDEHYDFEKSFTEHGYLIGLAVCRYDHTYNQGLHPTWRRKERFDLYWPVFQSIGEQPLMNSELYAQGPNAINPDTGVPYDDEVFGYQEAWSEYRFANNEVNSEMRTTHPQSLDLWHFADNYASMPYLSDAWLREDKSNVDRCLAVQSSIANQIFGDFYFTIYATRPMPAYSVPGYLDHF